GAEAIVLDLRRNLGGLLREARNVCDLFLPEDKLVTYTESRIEETEKWFTKTEPLVPMDMPVVVLIDRFSASASEIVSGALQDHGRATIIGQRSFGKGSVQQLLLMPGERDDRYRDENGNGQFDPWEKIVKDWNGNEKFDYAPRVRMTISRYMLPSGRSIHRELDREGNIESPGGVEPDIDVNPRRWEQWKLEEMVRINKTRDIRRWADSVWADNKDELVALALSDEHDWSRYPEFEGLYAGLETNLSKKDVRYLMRLEIRRRAQDERGSAFPAGDYQEDPMMQAGIRQLLEDLGKSYYDVDAFAKTFDAPAERETPPENELVSAELRRSDLENAITLVDEARRDDGRLSNDSLRKLAELLNSIED
ncbi:MAG: S41 family peptidase, partial [Planctomycetota bacterium]